MNSSNALPARPRRRTLWPMAGLLALAIALLPTAAAAHPLGNFTVNRYSRLEPAADLIAVRFVLDMAEIPAFQELQRLGAPDGALPLDAADRYARERAEQIRDQLRLAVDGVAAPLTVRRASLTLPPGQAGLRTLRLEAELEAPVTARAEASHRLVYRDETYGDRIGWKEVVVRAGPGAAIEASDAPTQDDSDELRRYPDSMLQAPLDRRSAALTYRVTAAPASTGTPAGGAPAAAVPATVGDVLASVLATARDGILRGGERVGALAQVELSWPLLLAALAAAATFGSMHALSPGHGKTIVAAYLVGARGTPKHALVLGLTVTATHTWAVFALGLVTLYLGQLVDPARLFPWLSLLSGLLVVAMGIGLLRARLARARGAHGHDHVHEHDHPHPHHHDHLHSHPHDHVDALAHRHGPFLHSHAMPDAVGWRGLIALGVSGGLLPCPSALLLLLASLALGRVALGLGLVVAFSLGLAGVLTAIGLLLVWARGLADRLSASRPGLGLPAPVQRAARFLPVGSALAVTLAGVVISAGALPALVLAGP